MITHKILGFLLLAVGLALILYSLFASYLIFTGSNEAPELFSAPSQEVEQPSSLAPGSVQDLQDQLLEGLLPTNTIPQMLNLAVWSMFASLLLFGGSLIAGIGVKLVK